MGDDPKPNADTRENPKGQKPRKEPEPDGPLTEEEIKEALENEGYPFELRVYKLLEERQLEPYFGSRLSTGPEDQTIRETDVIASDTLDLFRGDDTPAGLLTVCYVIEAKKIHKGTFVGFVANSGAPPNVAERIGAIGGLPSYGIRPPDQIDYDLFFDSRTGQEKKSLGERFEPLVAHVPLCIQWSVPRRIPRDKHGRLLAADHPPGVADDLVGTLQTAAKLTHNWTLSCLNDTAGLPMMTIALPVLVLDAPIYLYDVDDGSLEKTDRLALRVSGDTVLDRSDSHLVEVVNLDGLKELLDAVNDSLEGVAQLVEQSREYVNGLAAVGVAQKERWERDKLQRFAPVYPYTSR